MILHVRQTMPDQTTLPAGSGLLEFRRAENRTVVCQAIARSPLKLLNPRNHGSAAWVYMSSYGGGLLGGDSLDLEIDVGEGASALLSTQASTKIYRSDRASSQRFSAHAADGALLVVAPDPLVPFAHSSYSQQQTFHLAESANLVVVDWLNAGRWACGERWAFDHFRSRIVVSRGAREIVYESLRLDPLEGDVARRMGRFNTVLSAIVTGPALAACAAAVHAEIAATPLQRQGELVATASALKDSGVLLRIAAISPEKAGRALRQYLSFLCPLLGDDPWARKW